MGRRSTSSGFPSDTGAAPAGTSSIQWSFWQTARLRETGSCDGGRRRTGAVVPRIGVGRWLNAWKSEKSVLKENDRIAAELREELAAGRTLCLNLISSPGAGKTSILEGTLEGPAGDPTPGGRRHGRHPDRARRRPLKRYGFPALQITTGGTCHLDASMVRRSFAELPPDGLDILFIENVGNLVCPASYDLGEDAKVVVLSVAEGDDKPMKYPGIFRRARLMLLHKIDLLPHTRFSRDAAVADARRVNPEIEVVETSCVAEPGLGAGSGGSRATDGQATGGPTGPRLEPSTTTAARRPQPPEERPPDPAPTPENPSAETRFSRSWLLHFGHAGVRDATTSASNWCPHFLHSYSNKGMMPPRVAD